MPHDITGHDEDHVFSDVRRQVRDPLEIARDRQDLDLGLNRARVLRHPLLKGFVHRSVDLVDFFIGGLLHDLGKVIMNNEIPGYAKLLTEADEAQTPACDLEQRKGEP